MTGRAIMLITPIQEGTPEAADLIQRCAFAMDAYLKTVTDKATLPVNAWKPHVTVVLREAGVLIEREL